MRQCSTHGVAMELVRSLAGFLYYRCPVRDCPNKRSCKLYGPKGRIRGNKKQIGRPGASSRIPGDSPNDFRLGKQAST